MLPPCTHFLLLLILCRTKPCSRMLLAYYLSKCNYCKTELPISMHITYLLSSGRPYISSAHMSMPASA